MDIMQPLANGGEPSLTDTVSASTAKGTRQKRGQRDHRNQNSGKSATPTRLENGNVNGDINQERKKVNRVSPLVKEL